MALSREELGKLLTDLDSAVPALVHQYPSPENFNPAIAALADAVIDNASADDASWASEQIDEILERHGLWHPEQDDLAPEG